MESKDLGDNNYTKSSEEFHLVPPAADIVQESSGYGLQKLNFEDIYEACIRYVWKHWCYSSKFVRQMQLTDIILIECFHYILETFCEKRESADFSMPYKGQPIDGPENGVAPRIWDIRVQQPALFKDGDVKMVIPHTDRIKTCSSCNGSFNIRCDTCNGRGNVTCSRCHGVSGILDYNCTQCHGRLTTMCVDCYGFGTRKCYKCKGSGKLKCCKGLIVTWTNYRDDFMSDTGDLPSENIKEVKGVNLSFDESERLFPIFGAPYEAANRASTRLIEKHLTSTQGQRILKQRHTLRIVPITRTTYKWREKEGEFYVYGMEKKVYFEDYPGKCYSCLCF